VDYIWLHVRKGKAECVDPNPGESFFGLLSKADTGLGIITLEVAESSGRVLPQPLSFLRTNSLKPHYRTCRLPHLTDGEFRIFFQTVPGPPPKTDG